jgi:curved DNA-binding protein CbpA
MRDYYRILGVRPDATQDEIKEAWLFSVKAFHPDKFARSSQRQHAVAQERTKAINEAYEFLSDPKKRANYDREYAKEPRAHSGAAQPPPRPPPTPPPRPQPPPTPPPRPMGHFAQEFYEIAANEVAQHNVVRGIMAKAFTDAGGDEKKAIAYYIEYRAAQLAQEAKNVLRQKRRAQRAAATQRVISSVRPPVFGFLTGIFGIVTLISGLLTAFFALAGIGSLNQASDADKAGLIIIGFVGATVCGLMAAVFGVLTYKSIRVGIRK